MEFSFASFSMALVAVLLLLFGVVCGVKIGSVCAETCVTHKEYWIAHAKILGVGVLVSALLWQTGWLLLSGIPIGAMASALTVLKFEFGESAGPWKWHDVFFRVNKDQVKRGSSPSSRAHAQAVRRAKRDKSALPELMSVSSDTPSRD